MDERFRHHESLASIVASVNALRGEMGELACIAADAIVGAANVEQWATPDDVLRRISSIGSKLRSIELDARSIATAEGGDV